MTSKLCKIAALFLLTLCVAVSSASAQDKIRLLIIDGQNNHNWKATTPVLVKIFESAGIFTVDVATTPESGQKIVLKRRVKILSKTRTQFLKTVQAGGLCDNPDLHKIKSHKPYICHRAALRRLSASGQSTPRRLFS